jgi:hypothetical protein
MLQVEQYQPNISPIFKTKYKTVDKKVQPVPGVVPGNARVQQCIPEDPLITLLTLPTHPPEFSPTNKFTNECMELMKIDENQYIWPEEKKLFKHVLQLNKQALVWTDDKCGMFQDDYFSPYIFVVKPHVPWVKKVMQIPGVYYDQYIKILKDRIAAGVYKSSQASYQSTYFCVLKKNGTLCMVHDLQPLNAVSIQDTGMPPILDDFVESFAGHQIYTVLDMFSGYDSQKTHPDSRDLTSFMTPLGLLWLTTMPMGYTNAVAEYQKCMTFILQDKITAQKAGVFIDDVGIKGDMTPCLSDYWTQETIPENSGIQKFVWEHAQDVH